MVLTTCLIIIEGATKDTTKPNVDMKKATGGKKKSVWKFFKRIFKGGKQNLHTSTQTHAHTLNNCMEWYFEMIKG